MDDDETMDDDDFNEVIGNAPQSPTTRSSQLSTSGLSHGFVRTTYGAVNTTHFGPDVEFATGVHGQLPRIPGANSHAHTWEHLIPGKTSGIT